MTSGRRTLQFATLDDAMADVEALLKSGHETLGHWSLAQILRHISLVMRRVVDLPASTPVDPATLQPAEVKARIFETGLLPEGLPMPPVLEPAEATDPHLEAEAFREAIAHYKAKGGPVAPHRLFGPLTKDEWEQVQRIHCAHHLSFAIPKSF